MNSTPPGPEPATTTEVPGLGRFDRYDRDISRRLSVGLPRPRWIRLPLSALSLSANYGILWYVIALLPWLMGQSQPLLRALYVAVPVTLVELTGFVVKMLIARPRPPLADPTLAEQIPLPRSHSFPSSHASMAAVGSCSVAAMYPQTLPVLLALAATLCFSRVYLGVHYAGDILAGIVYGAFFGIAWIVLIAPPS